MQIENEAKAAAFLKQFKDGKFRPCGHSPLNRPIAKKQLPVDDICHRAARDTTGIGHRASGTGATAPDAFDYCFRADAKEEAGIRTHCPGPILYVRLDSQPCDRRLIEGQRGDLITLRFVTSVQNFRKQIQCDANRQMRDIVDRREK